MRLWCRFCIWREQCILSCFVQDYQMFLSCRFWVFSLLANSPELLIKFPEGRLASWLYCSADRRTWCWSSSLIPGIWSLREVSREDSLVNWERWKVKLGIGKLVQSVQLVQVVPGTTSHLFRPWLPAPNAEEILPPTSSPSRSILVPRSNCAGIQNNKWEKAVKFSTFDKTLLNFGWELCLVFRRLVDVRSHSWQPTPSLSSSFAFSYPEGFCGCHECHNDLQKFWDWYGDGSYRVIPMIRHLWVWKSILEIWSMPTWLSLRVVGIGQKTFVVKCRVSLGRHVLSHARARCGNMCVWVALNFCAFMRFTCWRSRVLSLRYLETFSFQCFFLSGTKKTNLRQGSVSSMYTLDLFWPDPIGKSHWNIFLSLLWTVYS